MQYTSFNFKTLDEVRQKLKDLNAELPLSENTAVLAEPLKLGGKHSANRIAIQPMEGCDGTGGGSPDELTVRRYDRFARSGAGLIWFEAVAIAENGRANKRQLHIHKDNADDFKRLVSQIKETSLKENGFEPVLIMQATHSGRYSKPLGTPQPIIAYNNPLFEKDRPIPKESIISDDELKALETKYGETTKLAREAGFDGVDIKCCHRYLNSELLSAFTREGEYGGSFENRTRFLANGVRAAAASAGSGFIITSRLNIYDGFPYPYGFGAEKTGLGPDFDEPVKLARMLHEDLKIELLDITMGNPYVNPHVNRPADFQGYDPAENPLEGVARMYAGIREISGRFPGLKVVSSGTTYLRQFSPNLAAGAVEQGYCSLAGFGRMAFAYPGFAKDLLAEGKINAGKCCITCGKCSELMRAGSVSGCVIRDRDVYLPIYRKAVGGGE